MDLLIDPRGQIRCVYAEAIDFHVLGLPNIVRASNVEPDAEGQWWADLAPVDGPRVGPFERRSDALACERDWLEKHWLEDHDRRYRNEPSRHAPGVSYAPGRITPLSGAPPMWPDRVFGLD